MKTLTPRQREVLEFVARFLNAEGRAPTIRQIAQHFQIQSPQGAHRHLVALDKKDYLKPVRSPNGCHRGFYLTENGLQATGQACTPRPEVAFRRLESFPRGKRMAGLAGTVTARQLEVLAFAQDVYRAYGSWPGPQHLADFLQIRRIAAWHHIQRLHKLGYLTVHHSSPGRLQFRLTEPGQRLVEQLLAA